MNTTTATCSTCDDADVVAYCDCCDAPCCADHGYHVEVAGLGESYGCEDCAA